MIVTLVDCLGKSVMAGYSLYRSEHSDHIDIALEKLGVSADNDAGVYMTDQGTGFGNAAEKQSACTVRNTMQMG